MTSRTRWDQIARTAPYFAVFAERRYLEPDAEAIARFHATGDEDVAHLLDALDVRAGGGPGRIRTVLELGCGPGRLAGAFARRGFDVTACDVSPEMLRLTRAQAPGVETLLEHELAADRAFDLVSCMRLLQHLGRREALALVHDLPARVAPGGFLHIQFPFRTRRTLAGRAALGARARVPLLNRAANAARGRRGDVPLLAPHIHSLDDVLSTLTGASLRVLDVEVLRENELDIARVTAVRDSGERRAPRVAPPSPTPDFIDVRALMRATSLDEWNRRAEHYFAGMKSVDAQLAKPFSSLGDAPALLINLGALLSAAAILPGMTVVDFGAGTGWLTRALAQLGCHVISIDVSQSALDIARRDLEARPLLGNAPMPRFLRFDGTRIELDDASVDRILCFDAFHHVPNPEPVLRELARILKPGAVAAFSEPGPRHSHSAQSQFEMRTYGVLENDIDLHALWPAAQEAGFAELRVAVFCGDAYLLDLPSFDELLSGGTALVGAARKVRDFLMNIRMFTLRKGGTEMLDSRAVGALRAEIEVSLRSAPRAGAPIDIHARVRNSGAAVWLPSEATPGGVCLGVHLYADGTLERFDHHWEPLPRSLAPGEEVTLDFALPPLPPGRYVLEFDCVAQEVSWFAMAGSLAKRLAISLAE